MRRVEQLVRSNAYKHYFTTLGSQVATSGKKHKITISSAIAAPNGITPLIISVILLSGLMPCSTNRFMPTGGVISGKRIGSVIKIIETDSKIQLNRICSLMQNKV